ncbi:hypothetical protein DPEC_G00325420 [Dallia pectoralis]|uniref:Uncharacterized protein n=1 Tax=Dallia pectoralis TaxID=75939 RepID=A0ACC2F7S0_DALPE|nr:hypothetical protein DPEC_G00325420 [Dallia pectoralis]
MNLGGEERGDHISQHRASSLGEALRQLPLLNALLVELSQLKGQNQLQQPLFVHPDLVPPYRPVDVPQTSDGQTDDRTPSQRPSPSPSIKNIRCSRTPLTSGNTVSRASLPNRTLGFGTNRTFCLRMKKINTAGVSHLHQECQGPPTKTWQHPIKGKQFNNTNYKATELLSMRNLLNRSSVLSENMDTLKSSMDQVKVSAAQKDTSSGQELTSRYRTDFNAEGIYCKTREISHRKCQHLQTSKQDIHAEIEDHDHSLRGDDRNINNSVSSNDQPYHPEPVMGGARGMSLRSPNLSNHEPAKGGARGRSLESVCGGTRDKRRSHMSGDVSIHPVNHRIQQAAKPSKGAMTLVSSVGVTRANRSTGTWSEPVQGSSVSENLRTSSQLSDTHTESIKETHVRAHVSYLTDSIDIYLPTDYINTGHIPSINSRPGRGHVDPYTSTGNPSIETHKVEELEEEIKEDIQKAEVEEAGQVLFEELEDTLGSLGFSEKCQHISELLVNKLPGCTL